MEYHEQILFPLFPVIRPVGKGHIMPKTINSNQLTVGATYLVRGKVGFSRITRQTTDEERERENKRRMYAQTTNYSNISIYNAQVIAKDPQNPTLEEKYAAECLYKSSSQNYPGANFSAMNKSKNLPAVAELKGPNNYVQFIPKHELAQGLDVTLVMRVYKSGQRNNGVNLDTILINGPVEYYGGNNDPQSTLSEWGITYQALPPKDQMTDDGVNVAAAEAAAASNDADGAAFAANTNNFGASFGAVDQTPQNNPAPQETIFSNYSNNAGFNGNTPFGPGADRQY